MNEDANPPSVRERMVYQAAQKLRAGGPAAASMRHVAEAADAPRGSLQHYFPGGKDELVEAALAWSGRYAAANVQAYLTATAAPTPSGILAAVTGYWVGELERCDFTLGCPLVGAVAGGLTTERSRAAARETLRAWAAPISAGLRRARVDELRAEPIAGVMLAAVEGAILLCRIERSTLPLRTLEEFLGPWLDGQVSHPSGSPENPADQPTSRVPAPPAPGHSPGPSLRDQGAP